MIDEDAIRYRWETVGRTLDERGRRLFAARGRLGRACGGVQDHRLGTLDYQPGRGRSGRGPAAAGAGAPQGGGRKAVSEKDPALVPALQRLVEPATLGDPERPLLWGSKSMDKLAAALTAMWHPISADTVAKELIKLGYSRQHDRKADEGSHHPDRNAQFEHINAKVVAAQAAGQPVISVDTKKSSSLATSRTAAPTIAPKGEPARVNVHDFEDKTLG
jgi:hypothetical protein